MWDPIAIGIGIVVLVGLGFMAALALVMTVDRHIQQAPRRDGDRDEERALRRFLKR